MTMITPNITPEEAREWLTGADTYGLAPGATVYVIQRWVNRMGDSRRLSLYVMAGSSMCDITGPAAAVMGDKIHAESHAVIAGGSGMNMHAHTVDRLARTLFGDGDALTAKTL